MPFFIGFTVYLCKNNTMLVWLFLIVVSSFLFADPVPLDLHPVLDNDHGAVYWHMPNSNRHVAITFDDGPDQLYTPQILDILANKNVKATFFVVGHMVQKYPHILHRIHNAGHEIANHTWAHYRLDECSFSQIQLQISETSKVIQSLGVPLTPYFRPPGGRYNNYVIRAAQNDGLSLIMWDVNAADYKHLDGRLPTVNDTVQRVMSNVKPGSIILMHNSIVAIQALPIIIDQLKNMDYSIGLLKWK